jgi:hypothetical protein
VSAISLFQASFIVLIIAGYGVLAIVMLSRGFYSVIHRAPGSRGPQRCASLPTNEPDASRDSWLVGGGAARKEA